MLYPLSYGGQERIAATPTRFKRLAATAIVGPGRAPDLHLERTPLPCPRVLARPATSA
jgi:hypothetical protein